MLEFSALLGWLSAAVLFAALAALLKLGRGPLLRRLNGRSALETEQVENASRLLVFAVGLSGVSAAIGIAGWVFA